MNSRRLYNEEDYDMYYRSHITGKKIDYILGFIFVDAKTINYKRLPGSSDWNDSNNASKGSVELETDEKPLKTFSTTHHEINFNSEKTKVLGFTKKKYPVRTRSGEKPTNIAKIDKVNLKGKCFEESIVIGRPKAFFSTSVLHLVLNFSTHLHHFLFKKVNENEIGDKSFYPEDEYGTLVEYIVENLTFTVMLLKSWTFFYPEWEVTTYSKSVPLV